MAKRDDLMQGRAEGMAFALRIAREGGIEALEKEIRMRNIWGLQVNVPMKDIQEIKTRKSEFLKMFPNAKMESNGFPCSPPCNLDTTIPCRAHTCEQCKKEYWLAAAGDEERRISNERDIIPREADRQR